MGICDSRIIRYASACDNELARRSPRKSAGCRRPSWLTGQPGSIPQVPINAVSLTTPAVARVFFFAYQWIRTYLCVGARTASFSAASAHPCHPNLLSPFPFINSVLPTKHLFDHHRPW